MSSISVKAIDHIVLNVRSVAKSSQWYSKVLGMKHEKIVAQSGIEKNILLFGRQKINLRPISATQEEWFTAQKAVEGTSDLCFLVESSIETVVQHLKSHQVHIERGPVVVDGAMGKMRSVYCRDPDGSLIEIASY